MGCAKGAYASGISLSCAIPLARKARGRAVARLNQFDPHVEEPELECERCGEPLDSHLARGVRIGVIGVFEATPMATLREVFETNTFGVMAMTQALLPQLRARRSGVVVNVTSSVRIAVAKDLLRRHDFALAEVAERVGYGSASTFSTAFSRHVGQPPSRYARER
jgi:AraC-like DNA-binding protein